MTKYPHGTTDDRYNHDAAEDLPQEQREELYRLWKEERHDKASAILAPVRAKFDSLGVSFRPPLIPPSREFQLCDEMFGVLVEWSRRNDLPDFVRQQTLFILTRHGGENHIESLVELFNEIPSSEQSFLKMMLGSEIGRIVMNNDVEHLRKALTDPSNGKERGEIISGLRRRKAKVVREFVESVRNEDTTLEPFFEIKLM